MPISIVFRGDAGFDDVGRSASLSVYEDGSAMAVFSQLGMSVNVHFEPGELAKVRALFVDSEGAEKIKPAPVDPETAGTRAFAAAVDIVRAK